MSDTVRQSVTRCLRTLLAYDCDLGERYCALLLETGFVPKFEDSSFNFHTMTYYSVDLQALTYESDMDSMTAHILELDEVCRNVEREPW